MKSSTTYYEKARLSRSKCIHLRFGVRTALTAMDFSHGGLPISLPPSHLIHSAVSWQTVLSLVVFNCYWFFIDSYLQRNFTAACFIDGKSPVNSLEIVKKVSKYWPTLPTENRPSTTGGFFLLCVCSNSWLVPFKAAENYFQTEGFSFIKILWFVMYL